MEVIGTVLSDVPLLKVVGVVDHLTASALEDSLHQALGNDGAYLLIDLSGCPYIDSGGLSVLLFACRKVRDKGWVGVIGPGANLLRLFQIVGLTANRGFRVFAGHEEARAALQE